jgi:hypothetical protein
MAAVAQLVVLVLAIWTAAAFAVAVVVGRTLRRLEPVPVPVRTRAQRVVDLRTARSR